MATENILMLAVKKGGDRQLLHERIRFHSLEAAKAIKEEGRDGQLRERILGDAAFMLKEEELDGILQGGELSGRAAAQTAEFLAEVSMLLQANQEHINQQVNIRV